MGYVRYENAVKVFYNNLEEFVTKFQGEKRNIVLFGTSKISGMIVAYLEKKDMKISYIIDNAKMKHGKKAYGLDIYSPECLKNNFDENVLVLIASGFQDAMEKQLEEMGYEKGRHFIKIIDLPELMNDYSFVDRSDFTLLTQDEIKTEMLCVLKYLDKVCTENNLKYYLFGGTLLGAVRHKGFIPWDDDIDVLMEVRDMIRLSEILKNDKNYSIVTSFDDSDYYDELGNMFSEKYIVDSNHFPMQFSAGVSIDIFPLFGVPDTIEEIDAYLEGFKQLEMRKWNCLYDKKKCQEIATETFQYLLKYDFYESKYVASSSNHYTKTIVPQEYYLNSVKYDFEGMKLNGPSNYDYILSRTYGDYMTLPPVEQRVGWHTYHAYKYS